MVVLGFADEGYIFFKNPFSYLQFLSNTELLGFFTIPWKTLEKFKKPQNNPKHFQPLFAIEYLVFPF